MVLPIVSAHGEILGFVPKTENQYFSVTKESARRRQNMDKVAKPKTCGISILHNEKKFSDHISHFFTPKIWKNRFDLKIKKIRGTSTVEPFPVPKIHFRSKFRLPLFKLSSQEYISPIKQKSISGRVNSVCPVHPHFSNAGALPAGKP